MHTWIGLSVALLVVASLPHWLPATILTLRARIFTRINGDEGVPIPGAVQRQRREAVGVHFILRKLVDVFQAVQSVILARRIVLPELDFGAQHRRLSGHAVLHPPRRDEDDVGKLPHDLEVRLEPELRIEK